MSTMPRTPLVPTPEIVGAAIRRAYIKALKAHIRDEVPMVVSEDGVIRHLSVEEMKAILEEELKDGP